MKSPSWSMGDPRGRAKSPSWSMGSPEGRGEISLWSMVVQKEREGSLWSGAAGYARHGGVDLVAGVVVGIGAIIGGVASAKLANTFSEQKLSQVAGGFFVMLGIIMTIILMNGNLAMA